ncbi:MAG: hypothetical protein JW995_07890 [Melioribacteraceae bacterium]|nr:hypothetical protein [Melioribacteraceae bacterium]
MKKLITYSSILLLILTGSALASQSDSVDVKAIVKQQIMEAQQKQTISETSKSHRLVKKSSPVVVEASSESENFSFPFLQFIILGSASLIAAGVVLKRRLKMKKIADRIKLKQNVKALREERLVKEIDPRLKYIRKRLCLNSIYLKKPEKEIIIAARKLQLAKEEFLLASRLNAHQFNRNVEVRMP